MAAGNPAAVDMNRKERTMVGIILLAAAAICVLFGVIFWGFWKNAVEYKHKKLFSPKVGTVFFVVAVIFIIASCLVGVN